MRLFLVYNLLMSFRRTISTDYPLTFEFYCRDTTNFKITTPSIDSGNPDSSPPGIRLLADPDPYFFNYFLPTSLTLPVSS